MSELRATAEERARLASAREREEDESADQRDEGEASEPTGRTLAGDLRRLEAEARRLCGAADEIVREQVAEAPLLCVGIALGAGVILGGGISRRTASALVALGGRASLEHLRSTLFAPNEGSEPAAGAAAREQGDDAAEDGT